MGGLWGVCPVWRSPRITAKRFLSRRRLLLARGPQAMVSANERGGRRSWGLGKPMRPQMVTSGELLARLSPLGRIHDPAGCRLILHHAGKDVGGDRPCVNRATLRRRRWILLASDLPL